GSLIHRSSCSLSEAASLNPNNNPLYPSLICSVFPYTLLAMTGIPAANASCITKGLISENVEHKHKASYCCMVFTTSSCCNFPFQRILVLPGVLLRHSFSYSRLPGCP